MLGIELTLMLFFILIYYYFPFVFHYLFPHVDYNLFFFVEILILEFDLIDDDFFLIKNKRWTGIFVFYDLNGLNLLFYLIETKFS